MKIYTSDYHHEYSPSLVHHKLAAKAYFLTPHCQTSQQPIKKKIHLRVTAEPSYSQADPEDPQLPELYQDTPESLNTIASFSRGFENFLRYLASPHPASWPEPNATSDAKATAAVETILNQCKLAYFDGELDVIISPSSHEILVVFQIHTLDFTGANAPEDLKHKLRHLLFLYQKVSARYASYKPISSGYLLADDSTSVPAHIWGQAQLSWTYLELSRWLDPLSPCYELHAYYATLLRRLCFLIGPGGFHHTHLAPIWIWGDYDGSLGLLLSREGHEIVSFHNHSPRHCQARGQNLDIPYLNLTGDPHPQTTKKISASDSQNYESSENFWKILREKNQLTKAYHYLNSSGTYFDDLPSNKPADILQKAPGTALITTFDPDSPFVPHSVIHELQSSISRGARPMLILALDPSVWVAEENLLSWSVLHKLGYTLKQSESYHLLGPENHPDKKTHLLILEPPRR